MEDKSKLFRLSLAITTHDYASILGHHIGQINDADAFTVCIDGEEYPNFILLFRDEKDVAIMPSSKEMIEKLEAGNTELSHNPFELFSQAESEETYQARLEDMLQVLDTQYDGYVLLVKKNIGDFNIDGLSFRYGEISLNETRHYVESFNGIVTHGNKEKFDELRIHLESIYEPFNEEPGCVNFKKGDVDGPSLYLTEDFNGQPIVKVCYDVYDSLSSFLNDWTIPEKVDYLSFFKEEYINPSPSTDETFVISKEDINSGTDLYPYIFETEGDEIYHNVQQITDYFLEKIKEKADSFPYNNLAYVEGEADDDHNHYLNAYFDGPEEHRFCLSMNFVEDGDYHLYISLDGLDEAEEIEVVDYMNGIATMAKAVFLQRCERVITDDAAGFCYFILNCSPNNILANFLHAMDLLEVYLNLVWDDYEP